VPYSIERDHHIAISTVNYSRSYVCLETNSHLQTSLLSYIADTLFYKFRTFLCRCKFPYNNCGSLAFVAADPSGSRDFVWLADRGGRARGVGGGLGQPIDRKNNGLYKDQDQSPFQSVHPSRVVVILAVSSFGPKTENLVWRWVLGPLSPRCSCGARWSMSVPDPKLYTLMDFSPPS